MRAEKRHVVFDNLKASYDPNDGLIRLTTDDPDLAKQGFLLTVRPETKAGQVLYDLLAGSSVLVDTPKTSIEAFAPEAMTDRKLVLGVDEEAVGLGTYTITDTIPALVINGAVGSGRTTYARWLLEQFLLSGYHGIVGGGEAVGEYDLLHKRFPALLQLQKVESSGSVLNLTGLLDSLLTTLASTRASLNTVVVLEEVWSHIGETPRRKLASLIRVSRQRGLFFILPEWGPMGLDGLRDFPVVNLHRMPTQDRMSYVTVTADFLENPLYLPKPDPSFTLRA